MLATILNFGWIYIKQCKKGKLTFSSARIRRHELNLKTMQTCTSCGHLCFGQEMRYGLNVCCKCKQNNTCEICKIK